MTVTVTWASLSHGHGGRLGRRPRAARDCRPMRLAVPVPDSDSDPQWTASVTRATVTATVFSWLTDGPHIN